MTGNVDLSGYSSDRYFSRAWRLVTQQKGWWKTILLMGVALLVPIAGPLAVLGYQLEWARLLAWDVNEPINNGEVHVGKLIGSGWRGFLAMLGWGILDALIGNVLSEVPGLGGLLDLVWTICGIFISMMVMVAAIRATIYQKVGAGYAAKNLWEMLRRDPVGLVRVWFISFVASIIESIIAFMVLFVSIISVLPNMLDSIETLYYYGDMMSQREAAFYVFDLIGTFFGGVWPSLLLLLVITLFLAALVATLTFAALALWMRQFDVPSWGKSSDPLPASRVEDAAEKDYDAEPEVPVAPVAVAPATPEASEDEPVVEVVAEEAAGEVPAAPVEETPETAETTEPPIPGEETAEDEPEAEPVDVEVIAPARAEDPAPADETDEVPTDEPDEVLDIDAETSGDDDPASDDGDPASSDEEESAE